jgi:hypothetical protein
VGRILLYAPDVVGHPPVYCRVIADALASSGCEMVLAMGLTDAVRLTDVPDVAPLFGRPGITIVESRAYSDAGLTYLRAEELVRLQAAQDVETTLLIEADKSLPELKRIAAGQAPRLRGRNLGIFANTAEWYPGEDPYTGEVRRLRAATLRTTLGNIKRALFERSRSARHLYERVLIGNKVLDEILVKDERLAEWHGPPVYWMPEISRPAGTPETPAEAQTFAVRQKELSVFLSRNVEREPALYFGDAAFYKGYDLFLQFVASMPSVCAIHAGRSCDAQERKRFAVDVDALRARLREEGRLHETGEYVHAQRLKELYFGAVRLYITTHRLTLSSSTVIQALEMGKPVLVPDRGLLGHRVRANGLGDVYAYGSLADLATKAQRLWGSDLTHFDPATRSYWRRFSDEAIQDFFKERLVGAAGRPASG